MCCHAILSSNFVDMETYNLCGNLCTATQCLSHLLSCRTRQQAVKDTILQSSNYGEYRTIYNKKLAVLLRMPNQ